MVLDINAIQSILPHRYPFLMVDAVLEMERLTRIVGIKNVSINEHFFQGHFPGKPIFPGVLIIEAMAQTGGLLLLLEVPDREHKLLYFVAVDDARFRRPVLPGEQLRLEVTVISWRGNFCKLRGVGTVNGELAAEATLMCKMVDRESAPASAVALPAAMAARGRGPSRLGRVNAAAHQSAPGRAPHTLRWSAAKRSARLTLDIHSAPANGMAPTPCACSPLAASPVP